MNKLIVTALVLLTLIGQVSLAAAQAGTPPPPVDPNSQPLPWWFRRTPNMPGMPWFYKAPTPPPQRQCRVVAWYPAQFWNTDEWGKTVTWVGYAPQYACS